MSKDLLTGDILVTASDNNYIASIQVIKPNDSVTSAGAIPVQTAPGQTSTTRLDVSDAHIGEYCYVVVADYAGNSTGYEVRYDGEKVSSEGKIFGFTYSGYRGTGDRVVRIDPDSLYYSSDTDCGGMENLSSMPFRVTAAEYVDGNIYMANSDGYLYVGTQEVWNDGIRANYFADVTPVIKDLAFNYQNSTLYALGAGSDLYAVDLSSCKLTKVADVSVTNPVQTHEMYAQLIALAIDDGGNFYVTNYGNWDSGYLYRFTLDDVKDGKVENLVPRPTARRAPSVIPVTSAPWPGTTTRTSCIWPQPPPPWVTATTPTCSSWTPRPAPAPWPTRTTRSPRSGPATALGCTPPSTACMWFPPRPAPSSPWRRPPALSWRRPMSEPSPTPPSFWTPNCTPGTCPTGASPGPPATPKWLRWRTAL